MFQLNFEWDVAKALSNRQKHDISFDLAATIFHDPLMVSIVDKDHREAEERWLTLGQAENGKLLVVVHTYCEVDVANAGIRIISARSATKRERRQYEAK